MITKNFNPIRSAMTGAIIAGTLAISLTSSVLAESPNCDTLDHMKANWAQQDSQFIASEAQGRNDFAKTMRRQAAQWQKLAENARDYAKTAHNKKDADDWNARAKEHQDRADDLIKRAKEEEKKAKALAKQADGKSAKYKEHCKKHVQQAQLHKTTNSVQKLPRDGFGRPIINLPLGENPKNDETVKRLPRDENGRPVVDLPLGEEPKSAHNNAGADQNQNPVPPEHNAEPEKQPKNRTAKNDGPWASSTDPETGVTTTSVGNPDGTRTVTRTDMYGNFIDEKIAGKKKRKKVKKVKRSKKHLRRKSARIRRKNKRAARQAANTFLAIATVAAAVAISRKIGKRKRYHRMMRRH